MKFIMGVIAVVKSKYQTWCGFRRSNKTGTTRALAFAFVRRSGGAPPVFAFVRCVESSGLSRTK